VGIHLFAFPATPCDVTIEPPHIFAFRAHVLCSFASPAPSKNPTLDAASNIPTRPLCSALNHAQTSNPFDLSKSNPHVSGGPLDDYLSSPNEQHSSYSALPTRRQLPDCCATASEGQRSNLSSRRSLDRRRAAPLVVVVAVVVLARYDRPLSSAHP
jgi:hypothetical protein